jgi:citrate synthase
MTIKKATVTKRDDKFNEKIVTKIWQEQASPYNPYLAEKCLCHGYDLEELSRKKGYADVLFLLFNGELPNSEQAKLLETLLVALINPGPRHPATRAAMTAGVGKTNPAHILPIGITVMGGAHMGGEEVSKSIRFLRKNIKNSPIDVAGQLESGQGHKTSDGDEHIAPGFGSRYGGIDPMPQKIARSLLKLPGNTDTIKWGQKFVETLKELKMGWLTSGVAAAAFCDLGFHPRAGAGLFQIISAPGILAHGLEMANKPITAMPFLDEEHYVIAPEAKKQG